MLDWVAATFFGAGLGLTLYGLVRLRMYLGPIIRRRYGEWARYANWLVNIVVMVLTANIGLMLIRMYLGQPDTGSDYLKQEIWFALLAMAIPLSLIFIKLKKLDV